LAKSPTTVGTGIAWMLDDWKDKDVAIQNLQKKVDSVVNRLKQVLGTQDL